MKRDERGLHLVASGLPAVNDNLSPAEVQRELARLIATQDDGGLPQTLAERRRASQLELARLETRCPVGLTGEELREHTIYYAKCVLLAAGLDTDGKLREHVGMTLDRAEIARKSAAITAALCEKIDALLDFVEMHEQKEFDEHGYRRPQYDSEAWYRASTIARNLSRRYDEIREGSLSDDDLAELTRPYSAGELNEIAKWAGDEPDQVPGLPGWVAAAGESLTLRACIIAALAHAPWNHRLRACASIVLGQWPASITQEEPLSTEHVIAIERENLRRLYFRLIRRAKP